jgi:hypothetical protein
MSLEGKKCLELLLLDGSNYECWCNSILHNFKALNPSLLSIVLADIKCKYLPPTYLDFIQDIDDRCLLLMSSMSFVYLPFMEHQMMEKHHMD